MFGFDILQFSDFFLYNTEIDVITNVDMFHSLSVDVKMQFDANFWELYLGILAKNHTLWQRESVQNVQLPEQRHLYRAIYSASKVDIVHNKCIASKKTSVINTWGVVCDSISDIERNIIEYICRQFPLSREEPSFWQLSEISQSPIFSIEINVVEHFA